jgi:hypothetical protein
METLKHTPMKDDSVRKTSNFHCMWSLCSSIIYFVHWFFRSENKAKGWLGIAGREVARLEYVRCHVSQRKSCVKLCTKYSTYYKSSIVARFKDENAASSESYFSKFYVENLGQRALRLKCDSVLSRIQICIHRLLFSEEVDFNCDKHVARLVHSIYGPILLNT